MNTVFDPDKWKNKKMQVQAWYSLVHEENWETDQFCTYQKYKEGETYKRHSVRTDRNAQRAALIFPVAFFSAVILESAI